MLNKVKQFVCKNYMWIICGILIIIFLGILEDVFESEIMKCDTISYSIVVNYLRRDWVTNIIKVITQLGSAPILIAISISSLIIIKDKKIGMHIILNLAGITMLNVVLKNIVQRSRPEGYRLIDETGYSFPSGHSMVSTVFYGLIIYLVYTNVKNKKIRNTICTVLVILILLIGCSRIYLGVHYASDVIAGIITSVIYLIIVIKFVSKLGDKNEKINEKF